MRIVQFPFVVVVASCTGATEEVTAPLPAPTEPPEASRPEPRAKRKAKTRLPPPASELEPWQHEFAKKGHKNLRDYIMLLPTSVFECELDIGPDTVAERDAAVLEGHEADLYRLMKTDGRPLQVALYVDEAHDRDVIGLVKNGGAGDMCNLERFQVWNQEQRIWREVATVPRDAIDQRVRALRGEDTLWWLELPERGTDTDVVDGADERILTLRWTGGRFVIAPP